MELTRSHTFGIDYREALLLVEVAGNNRAPNSILLIKMKKE